MKAFDRGYHTYFGINGKLIKIDDEHRLQQLENVVAVVWKRSANSFIYPNEVTGNNMVIGYSQYDLKFLKRATIAGVVGT